jgi:hypothetical protein
MMKFVIAILAFAVAGGGIASADDLRLSTDVAVFAKPIKEAECLDKAKTAIVAAKFAVSDAVHAKAGKKSNMVVMVDCLQSWKSDAAHISVAYLSADPKDATAAVAAIKKALEAK